MSEREDHNFDGACLERVRRLQEKAVDATIIVIAGLGLPWLMAAVREFGWQRFNYLEASLFVTMLGIAFNLRRFSFEFKALNVLLAGSLIGAGVLLEDGLNSRSGLYFLAVSVFGTLVLDPKVGYWCTALFTGLTIACGLGWVPHGMAEAAGKAVFWPGWALPSLSLTLLLVTCASRIHAALTSTIHELSEHSRILEMNQRKLESEIATRRDAEDQLSRLNAELEDRINQSHRELRILSQAVEQSPVSVVITDPKGAIEYVNAAFVAASGFERAEVIGQNPRLLQSGKTEPQVYTDLWSTILAHGTWHGEFINRKKNGEEYFEEAWIAPLEDEHGEILKFIGVKKDVTKRKELEEALRQLSITDANTGVANRRRFDQVLEAELSRAKRSGNPLSLVMLDIDFFKTFNDRFGHQAGDECLKIVAETLQSVVRRSGDLVARYGGEEFGLILPITDARASCRVAEEARRRVEKLELRFSGQSAPITISAGVCSAVPNLETTSSSLLSKADAALYRAKRDGRNRVECNRETPGPSGGEKVGLFINRPIHNSKSGGPARESARRSPVSPRTH